ncbi:MAG: YheT family hydrolase [Betaproteobacteria bacterium]
MEPYRAPAWLPGGHLQTIYPAAMISRPVVSYRRERWETPDGDFIDLDRIGGAAEAPLVVLFHGLEGCSNSHYALALMHEIRIRGWRGIVVHFRGCSGEPNRRPRAYHSGDTTEVDWILRRLQAERTDRPLYVAGVSLGGNALLKWLGERGDEAAAVVTRACAVSAPVDLMVAGEALGRGFNLLYAQYFLVTLKRKSARMALAFPGLFDAARVRGARTLREFDELVTAPLHGFAGTDDYWTRASSKPVLKNVAVPTLMVNAGNDPFLPQRALPGPHEVSHHVLREFPDTGGHAGFVTGRFPGRLAWLPQRMLAFFAGN